MISRSQCASLLQTAAFLYGSGHANWCSWPYISAVINCAVQCSAVASGADAHCQHLETADLDCRKLAALLACSVTISCATACRRRLDVAETGYLNLATALLEAPDPLPVLQGAAMLVLELEGKPGCPGRPGCACLLLPVLMPSAECVCCHAQKGWPGCRCTFLHCRWLVAADHAQMLQHSEGAEANHFRGRLPAMKP